MKSKELIKKINILKKQKNAVILVHNYQWPEIYQVADKIGDSLELSIFASKTKSKIIVFCGVDFMAESAKILNPNKTVLLPALAARCPMAAMVNIDQLKKLQKQNPTAKTVCYVNTSAETKMHCDVCCTSANAVKIVANQKAKKIIFVPDKNLANYVQKELPNKQIIAWEGYCYVHSRIAQQDLKKAIKSHPKAKVIIHPECPQNLLKYADTIQSTAGMIKYAKADIAKEYIIVTEAGMINRLQQETKNKKFYAVGGFCVQMKKNSLLKIYECLLNNLNEIKLSKQIIDKAKKPLIKMINVK